MNVLRVGRDAVLVEVGSTAEALALYDAGRGLAREVVPGARSVLFDGVGPDFEVPDFEVPGFEVHEARGGHVALPTTYDGPDLADTAQLLGLTADELVEKHTATAFTVAFCGFSPGFAYCTGLGLDVPRLDSPRTRVAPGSVGLAGEFTGVYPTASPGGWRIIGRTEVNLWDTRRDEPALLTPGTTVRFVAVRGGRR